MRTTPRESGSKAFIAFITPPKAATQIIITMTDSPALWKLGSSRTVSHLCRVIVPAKRPRTREETMPAPRQIIVCRPKKLSTMTTSIGTTM